MSLRLTRLERAVLEMALAGDHPVLQGLREQMESCEVKERRFTGFGFFTDFEMSEGAKSAPVQHDRLRIGDVQAKIRGLEHGAGFLLFVNDGLLGFLEGYSYDEPWPDQVADFEVEYETGARRNHAALGL